MYIVLFIKKTSNIKAMIAYIINKVYFNQYIYISLFILNILIFYKIIKYNMIIFLDDINIFMNLKIYFNNYDFIHWINWFFVFQLYLKFSICYFKFFPPYFSINSLNLRISMQNNIISLIAYFIFYSSYTFFSADPSNNLLGFN